LHLFDKYLPVWSTYVLPQARKLLAAWFMFYIYINGIILSVCNF